MDCCGASLRGGVTGNSGGTRRHSRLAGGVAAFRKYDRQITDSWLLAREFTFAISTSSSPCSDELLGISALSTVLGRHSREAKYSGAELLSRKRDRESPRERYFKIPRLRNSDRFAPASRFR